MKFLKAKRPKKANLKAEMAFLYKIQKDLAQKVVYWAVLFFNYIEKQSHKSKKSKISCLTMSALGFQADIAKYAILDFLKFWL